MTEYVTKMQAKNCITKHELRTMMVQELHDLPPADVRPNIHGHWKKAKKGITAGELSNLFKCSCCNYELYDDEFNFCPNCGADMRGSANE